MEDDRQNQNGAPQKSPPMADTKSKKYAPEQAKKELEEAIKGAEDVLIEVTTPLQIFPTTISLDRAKISVRKVNVISSTGVIDLPIGDVLNVTAHATLLFGWVKIDKQILAAEDPYRIGPFWRKDALEFSSIAQGYVIALQRKIDLNALSSEELRTMLHDLGRDKGLTPGESNSPKL